MKRWIFQILAVLVLATAADVPPREVSATTVHTFEEPVWEPIKLRDSSDHLPGLDCRLELIAMPNYVRHGNPVVRLELRNNLETARTFCVELRTSYSSYFCGSSMTTATRPVTLPPFGTARLNVPIFRFNAVGGETAKLLEVRETTTGTSSRIGRIPLETPFSTWRGNPQILMDHRLSPDKFSKNVANIKISGVEHGNNILRFKRAAADWPDDYRVYTTFDAVVVTPSLFANFPPRVLQALNDFTAFGGVVLVTPDDTESGGLDDPQVQDRFRSALERSTRLLTENYYRNELILEPSPRNHKHYPMPMLGLMVLFGISTVIAIPLAVWICIRRNLRFQALAIIPVAAAALSLAAWIASLIHYGTTPTERLQSVTVLDQRLHRAATWGQFAVFAPAPKSKELSFPLDSAFFAKQSHHYTPDCRHYLKRRLGVEVGDDYRLVGDWVPPLNPTIFEFQRAARRTEEIDIKAIGTNAIQVVNRLGAPVTHGRLRFGNHVYSFDRLRPGESQTLESTKTDFATKDTTVHHQLFDGRDLSWNWPQLVKHLNDPSLVLPECTYIAFVEGSPFFPSPFGQRRTHGSQEAVVVGQFAEDAK